MSRLSILLVLALIVSSAQSSSGQQRPRWVPVQPDNSMFEASDFLPEAGSRYQVEPFSQSVTMPWGASVDAMLLSRSRERNGVLASDGSGIRLSSRDLDLELAAGTEFTLRRGERFPLEIVYSVLDDWSSGVSETGNLLVHGPGFQQGFGNGTYRFDYASQFQSAGMRWYFWDKRLFIGPRWIELNEEIDGQLDATPVYSLRAENTLLGGQIGTLLSLSPDNWRCRFDILAGVGVFHHRARVTATSTNLAHGDVLVASGSNSVAVADPRADGVTLMSEASLRWSWRLNSHLSLRATGGAMWIDGLTLAPSQLPQVSSVPFIASQRPTADDHLLLLGVSVGVEAGW